MFCFPTPSSLNHLINRPVTMSWQETLAKIYCYLIKSITFAIEIQLFPHYSFLKNLTLCIIIHMVS